MDVGSLWDELEATKKELRLLRRENEDLKTKVEDMEFLIGKHGVHQYKVLYINCFLCIFSLGTFAPCTQKYVSVCDIFISAALHVTMQITNLSAAI